MERLHKLYSRMPSKHRRKADQRARSGGDPGVAESLLYMDFGATAEDKGNEEEKEKEGEEVVNGLIPAGARNCESGELPLMPTTRERADTVLTADGNSTVGASILRSSSPGFRPSTAQTLDSRRVGSSRSSTATKRVSFAGELGDTPLQTPSRSATLAIMRRGSAAMAAA